MLKVGDVVDVAAGLQRSSTCTGSGLSLKFLILVYVLVVRAVVRISVFTFVLPSVYAIFCRVSHGTICGFWDSTFLYLTVVIHMYMYMYYE